MKVRTYLSSRRHRKTDRSEPPTNPESLKEEKLNFEQIACHTLMEESWIGYENKKEEEEFDAFLRVTQKSEKKDIESKKEKFKSSSLLDNKEKIGKFTIPIPFPVKPIMHGFIKKNEREWSSFKSERLMRPEKIENGADTLVSREVLCLTQYVVSGSEKKREIKEPNRRPGESKYLKVLKQIQNRNTKNLIKYDSTHDIGNNSPSKLYFRNGSIRERLLLDKKNRELKSFRSFSLRINEKVSL